MVFSEKITSMMFSHYPIIPLENIVFSAVLPFFPPSLCFPTSTIFRFPILGLVLDLKAPGPRRCRWKLRKGVIKVVPGTQGLAKGARIAGIFLEISWEKSPVWNSMKLKKIMRFHTCDISRYFQYETQIICESMWYFQIFLVSPDHSSYAVQIDATFPG
jgi:hypothetical protein